MWASFLEVRVLRRVEEDPGTSVRRIAITEQIGVPLVWRIPHSTYITFSECKPSLLLTVVQGCGFAN
jgi:hypothetical protein